ncbi:MAG TPA: hypothetical protein VMT20_28025 [Terriglobia bacterium]|nr:hypothetical protein [Terriglobia bacterium]
MGALTLSIDSLSALFLLVAGLVFLPASIYSAGYLEHYRGHFNVPSLCACYFGLLSPVALVLMAADAVSFLLSWELMAILGNFDALSAPQEGYDELWVLGDLVNYGPAADFYEDC